MHRKASPNKGFPFREENIPCNEVHASIPYKEYIVKKLTRVIVNYIDSVPFYTFETYYIPA